MTDLAVQPGQLRALRPTALVIVTYEGPPNLDLLKNLGDRVDFLIVVDNSTSPGAQSEVENACRASPVPYTLVQNRANLGLGRAFNQGVEAARGHGCESVYLLDDDALVDTDFFETELRLMEELEREAWTDVGVVVPIVGDESPTLEPPTVAGAWTPVRSIISSGALFRISTFDSVGGFNEALLVDGVDFEFARRVRALGKVLARVNRVLIHQPFGQPIHSTSLRVRSLQTIYAAFYYLGILSGRSNSFHTRLSRYQVSRRAELVRSARVSKEAGAPTNVLGRMVQWAGILAALTVDSYATWDRSYIGLVFTPR